MPLELLFILTILATLIGFEAGWEMGKKQGATTLPPPPE